MTNFAHFDGTDDYIFDEELEISDRFLTQIFISPAMVLIAVAEHNTYTFYPSHVNYAKAKAFAVEKMDEAATDGITSDDVAYVDSIYTIKAALKTWSNGRLTIAGNAVYFDGDLVPQSLEERLLNMLEQGGRVDDSTFNAWSKFIDKLRDASNNDVYNRLHAFLKFNDLSIDDDGDIIAFKVVRPDYKDKHSGTFDNSVGQTPTIPRTKVDPNNEAYCSYGLHVCAFGYLSSFARSGDPVMLVKLDVRDIISVPLDYDGEKVRCCKYQVVGELGIWGTEIKPDHFSKHAG